MNFPFVAADVRRLSLFGLSRIDAVEISGSTAAPAVVRRALAPNTSAWRGTGRFLRVVRSGRAARARPAAPEAGALPVSTASFQIGASSTRLLRLCPFVVLVLALLSLAGCATTDGRLVRVSDTAEPQSYMRVLRPSADTVALQISLRRFVPAKGNGPVVWLSGASHLGESNYFASLQRHLDKQALVLFEGVGAKSKQMRFDPEEEISIQHTMATALGLVFQLSAIEYDRPSFRNSDMTIAQLQQLLTSGRSGGGARTIDAKAGEEFQELLNVMDGSSVLGTLMHMGLKFIGSNPKLQAMTKVLLVEILGQLKGDMSQMQGMPPEIQRMMEVIIRERNKVVFDDLKAEVRSFGAPRSISVFYGAGHMADLEKRLRSELDYRPRDEIWLTAISVNTRDAGLSDTELDMMRGLIKWQMDAIQPDKPD